MIATGPGWRLHLGRWQDVLADVEASTLISDPPYGGRTHDGHNDGGPQIVSATGQATREAIGYASWSSLDVDSFVESWSPRIRGWFACMTSHDLASAYESAYRVDRLYPFAPVGIVQKRPRLIGDGPASWLVYLMAARPRNVEFSRWGCLPGLYESHCDKETKIAGAKPLDLMRAIVRDYSRPGDLIVDPCAGGGTTLLAAVMEGRRAIGAEMDPKHFEIARKRLESAIITPPLFTDAPMTQGKLL
jgi:site-specific DNA-methyltransferase (adenine-specific)